MPDWVSNILIIYGTEEEITRFREFVKSVDEPFSFESILPTEYVNRPDEWGTKWNAHEVKFEHGISKLKYSFDTAWNAPRGVFYKLVDEFPTMVILWLDRIGDSFEGYILHYQGKQIGDLKFLDLDRESELAIFDLIVNGEVGIQRCQFEGEETKCPMFELADDPRQPDDCSKQKWEGFKSFCELLPENEGEAFSYEF